MKNKLLNSSALTYCSFSLAFFAVVPTINMILDRVLSMGEEAMLTPLYALSLILIALSTMICVRQIRKPSKGFWIILGSALLLFSLSRMYGVKSELAPVFFWLYTIISFIIPQFVLPDVKKMLRFMIILPSFGVLFLLKVFELRDSGAIGMDLTYSFLIPIISAIVYMFTYLKEDKGFIKLLMIVMIGINMIYFIFCLLFGSRAPALSVILCVVFMFCIDINNKQTGYRVKKVFFLWALLSFLIVFYFEDILISLSGLFKLMNWDSFNIDKMIMLYEMGDISDGRADINEKAWIGIWDSPIWGHGLSASERFTNHSYPHNFLLQLLLDGGVILFILILTPMIARLLQTKKSATYDENILYTVMFFASVPGALFSLDLWANSRFWLFMGFILSATFSSYSKKMFRIKNTPK